MAKTIEIPAAEAAAALKCSREALVRKIQRGEVAGSHRDGRWFVAADAVRGAARKTPAAAER